MKLWTSMSANESNGNAGTSRYDDNAMLRGKRQLMTRIIRGARNHNIVRMGVNTNFGTRSYGAYEYTTRMMV